MTTIRNEIEINAPIASVFEYYTNPDNIKEAWPREIIKNLKMSQVKKVKKVQR